MILSGKDTKRACRTMLKKDFVEKQKKEKRKTWQSACEMRYDKGGGAEPFSVDTLYLNKNKGESRRRKRWYRRMDSNRCYICIENSYNVEQCFRESRSFNIVGRDIFARCIICLPFEKISETHLAVYFICNGLIKRSQQKFDYRRSRRTSDYRRVNFDNGDNDHFVDFKAVNKSLVLAPRMSPPIQYREASYSRSIGYLST